MKVIYFLFRIFFLYILFRFIVTVALLLWRFLLVRHTVKKQQQKNYRKDYQKKEESFSSKRKVIDAEFEEMDK